MSALDDAKAKGNLRLNDLLDLMTKAQAAKDQAAENKLQPAIDDLTFQLGRLDDASIAADDAEDRHPERAARQSDADHDSGDGRSVEGNRRRGSSHSDRVDHQFYHWGRRPRL